MSRVVCPKAWQVGLWVALNLMLATVADPLQGATLVLAGVSEGSQIALPPGSPATNLSVTAVVSGAIGMPKVSFTLEWQGAILRSATSAPPYSAAFTSLAPGKYFLTAELLDTPTASSDVSFDIVSVSISPPNDLWSGRTPIPAFGTLMSGTNVAATAEPGEPNHADNGCGRSIWWSWQAGINGLITATTIGSDFDTVLAVYTGTNTPHLSLVAANDDAAFGSSGFSQATFTAVAGTTYHFAVDGALATDGIGASGRVELRLLAAAPPSIGISNPVNGIAIPVAGPNLQTNVPAFATISDPNGIGLVDYRIDGAGVSRLGTIAPPYHWNLTNLPPGDYLLSVLATSNTGLTTQSHVGFSVISLAPEIVFVDSDPVVPAGYQFVVRGRKGMTYEVQASTNLVAWNQQTRWTNFAGVQRAVDTNVFGVRERYYRVLTP